MKRTPIFSKALSASVIILLFGAYLFYKSTKTKQDYEMSKGKIDFIGESFDKLHPQDHRFIHLEGHQQVFELFIGNKPGDFGPKYERIDSLNMGDEITVYQSGKLPLQRNQDLRLSKDVEFIDKGDQAYYIRGNKNRYGGIGLIGIGALFILGLLSLKALKKID